MSKSIYLTFWIALFYVIGALIGFQLALLPGLNITLLWPPSGIALAAVLMRGNLALPGIFLGAFMTYLIELKSFAPMAMLGIALGISTSSTLATLFAGRFLKRFAPSAPIWASASDIVIGSIGMALACTISAFFGVTSAYLTGFMSAEVLPTTYGMWWLGEFVGMMVFTPLAFTIARRMTGKFWRKIKPEVIITPSILYSCTALFSVIIFLIIWNIESSKISQSLERLAAVAATSLTNELGSNAKYIVSVRAFIRSSQHVSHEEFQRFSVAKFEGGQGYPAAQAIGWAPKVTNPRAWELEQLSIGNSSVELFEIDSAGKKVPVAKRADYFPVEVMYPLSTVNRSAVGFDLGSEEMRRAALERARDTGKTSMMAPIYLVQSERRVPGMLVCSAIYLAGATLETIADRRANLAGFASGVFYIGHIFDQAMLEVSDDVNLHLFDESLPELEQWYHTKASPLRDEKNSTSSREPRLASLKGGFNGTAGVKFAGREWLVIATPGAQYIMAQRSWTPWGALLLLLLIGIVLSSILIERILAKNIFNAEQLRTKKALSDARGANESKSYFMAAASHDIKQPLYALGMLTDTLMMTSPSETIKPIVKDLSQCIREMSEHFDTLMDVGRFQDGSFEVTASRSSLSDIARRIDLEIAPLCRGKNLAWNIDVDNVFIHTDAELLLRLLRNLLINAVRYTSDGQVSFAAKSQGRVVNFRVSDTGVGLSQEQQHFLFSEARPRDDELHTYGHGHGLGLSIVYKVSLALSLGLQVVTSSGGTTFTFQCTLDEEYD